MTPSGLLRKNNKYCDVLAKKEELFKLDIVFSRLFLFWLPPMVFGKGKEAESDEVGFFWTCEVR